MAFLAQGASRYLANQVWPFKSNEQRMIAFDAAHKAVHYPPDRRFRIWIKPSFIAAAICLALIPLVLAWVQTAIYGLPYLAPVQQFNAAAFTAVHGFPWWLRWAHFFNFVFLMMLLRSGLSICLLYTSPSPRDRQKSRMPSSA